MNVHSFIHGFEMENKRELILSATQRLLAKHGFHGFSMKQLAEEAGVAAGTIYIYFKDKNDLIRQLHEQILIEVAEAIFSKHDRSLPLYEQYRQFWWSLWKFCISKPDMVMSKDQFDHLPPEIQKVQQSNAEKLFAAMVDMFEQGRRKKVLKPLQDDVLGSLSIETCTALARKQLLGLISLDDTTLELALSASWDAIAVNPSKLREG